MKTILLLLFLTASALAGDGYTHEANNSGMVAKLLPKMKVGEVVKYRYPVVEFDYIDDATSTAVFYYHKRGYSPQHEVKVPVTVKQRSHIEHAQMIFLRRTAGGLEYLGSKVSRDARGLTVYQY